MHTARILIAVVHSLDPFDLQQRITQMDHTVLAIATSNHEALHLAAALQPDIV